MELVDILPVNVAFDAYNTSAANFSYTAHEAHVYNYMRDWIVSEWSPR